MKNYAEPSGKVIAKSEELLPPLIHGLRRLNPGNSLAVFTTNYDLGLEHWCLSYKKLIKYIDGVQGGRWLPESSFDLTEDSVCLFYLHGCARWSIRLEGEHVIGFEGDIRRSKRMANNDIRHGLYEGMSVLRIDDYDYGRMYADPDQNLYPAVLFPSTVKRRYVHSPPFNFAYEQLRVALQSAKILLIVGYSGRDETFKEMLFNALKNNRMLRIIVLNIDGIPPHLSTFLPEDRRHAIQNKVSLSSIKQAIDLCNELLV
jgi:hypothetical protein